MSVYNNPDFKANYGTNTPSYTNKKNNSLNFTTNPGKFLQDNANKFQKTKLELKTNPKSNENAENNIIKYNNYMTSNPNINKLLTSTNKNNRRIEINLNKNYSPASKLNKSTGENIILLRHKQSTSQNNINNKISHNENNSNKECNIIINNLKEKNNNKSKSNLNNLNNINININISKKIISTYYNKSKDKKNIVIKKNSVNSINGTNLKQTENTKYYRINNKDNMNKNPSEIILSKFSSNDPNVLNINNSSTNTNTNKSKNNKNHSLYFSSNSNKNILYNKTNSNNTYKSNHINYTSNDIYNNTNNNNNANLNYKNYKKKNNGSVINKNVKDNKSMYLSQIQIPMNASYSPRNINSIQNYLKYLNLGQNNKNFKNSPQNRSKNQNQKFSASNINPMNNNNNIESSVYNNNKSNYEKDNEFKHNTFNKSDINSNVIRNCSPKNKNSKVKKRRNESNISLNNEIGDFNFENPEELHYFYVKIFQKGKIINFDEKNK